LRRGHAHFTTIEEIPAGEVVTAGKFLVNNHPAVVLFDSGASHSFISPSFASKFGQRIATIDKGGYCISAARNNIATNQLVRDACIDIEGREYTSHLVVLPCLGIDVILGMNWMSGHGVLIDTSTHVVMLRDPINNVAF
jgi:predicted aspartyl protease